MKTKLEVLTARVDYLEKELEECKARIDALILTQQIDKGEQDD